MTAITAANVTVTPTQDTRQIFGKNKRSFNADIIFGDGTLTYPALGIPLPTANGFGLPRAIDDIIIRSPREDGLLYTWDSTNKTIRIFYPTSATAGPHAGDEVATGYVPAATTIKALVIGR